jgi:hypothetical protein
MRGINHVEVGLTQNKGLENRNVFIISLANVGPPFSWVLKKWIRKTVSDENEL